jgi:hypothetical protein
MYCERGGQLLTGYVQSGSFVIRERLRLVLGEINTKTFKFLSVTRIKFGNNANKSKFYSGRN